MRVLMISRDSNTTRSGTAAFARMEQYRAETAALDIVVPTFRRIWSTMFADGQYDLVTSQDPFETGLLALLFARKFRARLELQLHTDFLNPFFRRESLKNRIRALIASFVLPRADCVRVVSTRIKNSLMRDPRFTAFSSRISVLPVYVDAERFFSAVSRRSLRDAYPQFDLIVLMASRITREKNISSAIRAFARAHELFPEAGMVVVGDGPEKQPLQQEVKTLGLDGVVVFEPRSDDLASYYKTADLFLLSSNYEGYGMTLVEAAASGCPIVTTQVGLVGDLLTADDCVAVPAGDNDALREALIRALGDGELRARIALRAQRAVLEVSRAHAGSVAALWRSCLS